MNVKAALHFIMPASGEVLCDEWKQIGNREQYIDITVNHIDGDKDDATLQSLTLLLINRGTRILPTLLPRH